MRIVAVILILILAAVARGQEAKSIPLQGDETKLAAIKANPQEFFEKPAILAGGAEVSDEYVGGYRDARGTHYSISLFETTKSSPLEPGDLVHLYLRRGDAAKQIVDELVKASGGLKLARVKVTVEPGRYGQYKQTSGIELIDAQFLTPGTDQWGPWLLGTDKQQAKKTKAKKRP